MAFSDQWVTVTLTLHQYASAMAAGRARHAARAGPADSLAADVSVAAAGLAWAVRLGVPWDGDAPDVCGYRVRATCHRGGRLLVGPSDPDHDPFVLAYTAVPTITFAGWLFGYEAKAVPLVLVGATPLHAVGYHMLRPVTVPPPSQAAAYLDLPYYRHPRPRTAAEYLSFPDPRLPEVPPNGRKQRGPAQDDRVHRQDGPRCGRR